MSLHPAPSWQQLKSQKKSWTGVWNAADQKIKRLAQNFNMVAADLFQEEMEKFSIGNPPLAVMSTSGMTLLNLPLQSPHDMRGLLQDIWLSVAW